MSKATCPWLCLQASGGKESLLHQAQPRHPEGHNTWKEGLLPPLWPPRLCSAGSNAENGRAATSERKEGSLSAPFPGVKACICDTGLRWRSVPALVGPWQDCQRAANTRCHTKQSKRVAEDPSARHQANLEPNTVQGLRFWPPLHVHARTVATKCSHRGALLACCKRVVVLSTSRHPAAPNNKRRGVVALRLSWFSTRWSTNCQKWSQVCSRIVICYLLPSCDNRWIKISQPLIYGFALLLTLVREAMGSYGTWGPHLFDTNAPLPF